MKESQYGPCGIYCGAEIIWYQKTCRCGRALDGWEIPSFHGKK